MAEDLVLGEEVAIPLSEVELRASRSSGPGGQHANVTASRIEAVFDVAASRSLDPEQRRLITERLGPLVTAVAQDARSQARNRELALARLAQKLTEALRVDPERRPTRPKSSARERRLSEKRRAAQQKRLRQRPDPGEE